MSQQHAVSTPPHWNSSSALPAAPNLPTTFLYSHNNQFAFMQKFHQVLFKCIYEDSSRRSCRFDLFTRLRSETDGSRNLSTSCSSERHSPLNLQSELVGEQDSHSELPPPPPTSFQSLKTLETFLFSGPYSWFKRFSQQRLLVNVAYSAVLCWASMKLWICEQLHHISVSSELCEACF